MRAFLLVFSLFLQSCAVAESDHEGKMIELELSVNQEALSDGVVILQSVLINHGHQFKFLPWNTPFDDSMSGRFLKVTEFTDTSGEKELIYQGRMIKRRSPVEEDYLIVGAGETLENQLDITKSYNFCQNRHYNIKLAGHFNDADFKALDTKTIPAKFKTSEAFPRCSP